MGAAKETPADFRAVSNHPAVTMLANGRDGLNRAFKAVECMLPPGGNQFKSFVVLVPTNFARGHMLLPSCAVQSGETYVFP